MKATERPLDTACQISTGRWTGRGTSVLGGPRAVKPELVEELRKLLDGVVRLDQPLVRVPALVRRRSVAAHVLERDVAHVEDRELADHVEAESTAW